MSNVIEKVEKQDGFFMETILKLTAKHHYMSIETIKSKTRKREVVQARQIAMYFAKMFTTASLATIGSTIGEKDHATVLHACKTVSNLSETDRHYRGRLIMLQERIEGQAYKSEYDMICIDCGSKRVRSKAWIDPNTRRYIEDIDGVYRVPSENFCMDCDANVQLIIRSEYEKLHAPPELEPELTEEEKIWDQKLQEIKDQFDT